MRFYRDVVGADLLVGPNDGASPSFVGRMAILSLGGRIFDLCEHSRNEGERFDPVSVADGLGKMFDFVDPDGIQIEFIHLNLG
jgi:glyoxylase I family protein